METATTMCSCGNSTAFGERKNGPHLELHCMLCDKHIRFVKRHRDLSNFVMPFGKKHKGRTFKEINATDPMYMQWFSAQEGKMADKIREYLMQEKTGITE